MEYTLFCDGASRGNPGPASCAAVLYEKERKIAEFGRYLGTTTNNVAEYQGLIAGLEGLLGHLAETDSHASACRIRVRMDSELVVRQITGAYRVKHEALKPLFEKARAMLDLFQIAEVSHVRRAENAEADRLANSFLDAHPKKNPSL